MRISMITIGSTGDVKPYILLGRELQKRGHSINLCAFRNFREMVEKEGFTFYPIDRDAKDYMQQILNNNKGAIDFLKNINSEIMVLSRVLIDAVDACVQAGDIAIGSFFGSINQKVAEKYNKKYVQTHFFPMDINDITPISSAKGFILGPSYYKFSYKLGHLLINLFQNYYINKNKEEYELTPVPVKMEPSYEINGEPFPVIYALSRYVLPPYEKWPNNIHVVGYFMEETPQEYTPSPELEEFLQAGEAPIYVGFGSMLSDRLQKFLNITVEACIKAGIRAVVVKGWKDFVTPQNKNIFVCDSIPHDYIFKHVKAVVHHGGAGTFGAGISHGKPTLIVPFGGDQPFNATRAFDLGVGPSPVHTEWLGVNKMEEKLVELISDPVYAQNALELAEKVNQEQGVQTAANIIESYMYAN